MSNDYIRIECPHCDKRLKVPVRKSHKKIHCPGCKTQFRFSSPNPSYLSKPPVRSSHPSPESPTRMESKDRPACASPEDLIPPRRTGSAKHRSPTCQGPASSLAKQDSGSNELSNTPMSDLFPDDDLKNFDSSPKVAHSIFDGEFQDMFRLTDSQIIDFDADELPSKRTTKQKRDATTADPQSQPVANNQNNKQTPKMVVRKKNMEPLEPAVPGASQTMPPVIENPIPPQASIQYKLSQANEAKFPVSTPPDEFYDPRSDNQYDDVLQAVSVLFMATGVIGCLLAIVGVWNELGIALPIGGICFGLLGAGLLTVARRTDGLLAVLLGSIFGLTLLGLGMGALYVSSNRANGADKQSQAVTGNEKNSKNATEDDGLALNDQPTLTPEERTPFTRLRHDPFRENPLNPFQDKNPDSANRPSLNDGDPSEERLDAAQTPPNSDNAEPESVENPLENPGNTNPTRNPFIGDGAAGKFKIPRPNDEAFTWTRGVPKDLDQFSEPFAQPTKTDDSVPVDSKSSVGDLVDKFNQMLGNSSLAPARTSNQFGNKWLRGIDVVDHPQFLEKFKASRLVGVQTDQVRAIVDRSPLTGVEFAETDQFVWVGPIFEKDTDHDERMVSTRPGYVLSGITVAIERNAIVGIQSVFSKQEDEVLQTTTSEVGPWLGRKTQDIITCLSNGVPIHGLVIYRDSTTVKGLQLMSRVD